jgi:dTDP-glucose 4,6-dehydratase
LKIVESSHSKLPKYNISGNEKSNIEIVRLFLKLMGKSESLISYVEDRPGHDFRYAVNDSCYISEYGEYLSGNFEHQIQSTINWYVENQDWLKRSLERLKK